MVTLSISRFAGPIWFFGDVHKDRVYMRAFIEVVCAHICERLRLSLAKRKNLRFINKHCLL